MTDQNENAALRERIAALDDRVATLEARLVEMERLAARYNLEHQVDEETLMVISAAVAAVLGHKAKVKQVHLSASAGWTAAGLAEVQDRSKTVTRLATSR